MKSLQSCTLFQIQEKGLDIGKRIMNFSPLTDSVDLNLLQEDLHTIQKRYNYPLKIKVLNDLNVGRIQLLYNKDKSPIPVYIPNFLTIDKVKGKPVCMVNLTSYGIMNKEKTRFDINTRQLYALMQSGTMALSCYEKWIQISVNQNILRLGAIMYSKLFTKVLDRMYAVNLDPTKSDKIKYVAAKFFLYNIMGKTKSSTVDSIAYSCCNGGTTLPTIQIFNDSFNENAYENLQTFIQELALKIDGMGELNLRSYIDNYMRMYDVSTLFSLEYFPAFAHMIGCVVVGAHMNRQPVIESLLEKELDKFYTELSNIIK
jgi:hypothetical protein